VRQRRQKRRTGAAPVKLSPISQRGRRAGQARSAARIGVS